MRTFEIFLIVILILGIIYLIYSFIRSRSSKEVKKDAKEEEIKSYLMAGESINDTFRIGKSFYSYVIFFTSHRILKLKQNIFGLKYFKDIHYRFLNSIQVRKVVHKKGITLSSFLIFLSIVILVVNYFSPDLITVSVQANKLIFYSFLSSGLLILFLSSIGRKYIYFNSYSTVMKIPFEERLVKEAREYQHLNLKKSK